MTIKSAVEFHSFCWQAVAYAGFVSQGRCLQFVPGSDGAPALNNRSLSGGGGGTPPPRRAEASILGAGGGQLSPIEILGGGANISFWNFWWKKWFPPPPLLLPPPPPRIRNMNRRPWEGNSDTFVCFLKTVSQFPRYGVGISSHMTDISDKQARKKLQQQKLVPKGGCLNPHNTP